MIAASKADAVSDSLVLAWCNCIGSGAVGSASGHALGSASASSHIAIRGYAKAVAWVKAQKAKILTSVSIKATGYAKSNASAKANTDAWVKVYCTDNPSQPTPQPEKPTVAINTVNDVPFDGQTDITFTVDLPGSDAGTLTLYADKGSFVISRLDVSGSNSYTVTYNGPADVTNGDLTETVTAKVTDTNTGLSASAVTTFKVNHRPTNTRP